MTMIWWLWWSTDSTFAQVHAQQTLPTSAPVWCCFSSWPHEKTQVSTLLQMSNWYWYHWVFSLHALTINDRFEYRSSTTHPNTNYRCKMWDNQFFVVLFSMCCGFPSPSLPLPPSHRHRDIWPSLPRQGQEEQGLLRLEADEDPWRDTTETGAARPQREGGADRGQPPLPHPTVSLLPSLSHKHTGGEAGVTVHGLSFSNEESQSVCLCIQICIRTIAMYVQCEIRSTGK